MNPIFEIGPLEPRYSEFLVFEGVCVDEQGKQHFLDATLASAKFIYVSVFSFLQSFLRAGAVLKK